MVLEASPTVVFIARRIVTAGVLSVQCSSRPALTERRSRRMGGDGDTRGAGGAEAGFKARRSIRSAVRNS